MVPTSSHGEQLSVPIQALFEAHLNVSSLQRSIAFYTSVLGMELAAEFPERKVAFVWAGKSGQSMLGLWETGVSPQRMTVHLALSVALEDLLRAPAALRKAGIAPLGFTGEPTEEPVVLAWMPAASVYFRDPDNNLLEFISPLDNPPRSDLGIVSWSDWLNRITDVC